MALPLLQAWLEEMNPYSVIDIIRAPNTRRSKLCECMAKRKVSSSEVFQFLFILCSSCQRLLDKFQIQPCLASAWWWPFHLPFSDHILGTSKTSLPSELMCRVILSRPTQEITWVLFSSQWLTHQVSLRLLMLEVCLNHQLPSRSQVKASSP